MQLPNKLKRAVDGNSTLSALLHSSISSCSAIISNKPEFFPEYTDHGPDHNTEVLNTAIDILTPETIAAMSGEDFTALALAVLLHDCGMHITGDSFVHLISIDNKATTRLDKQTWNQLWTDFQLEVKRFDATQNRRVFGTAEPASEPPADPADYKLRDRLFIGEFLRRHHPRLAHEIAIFGFPTVDGSRIEIVPKSYGDLPEVSGIVARSHGMSLRAACDIFSNHFHEREYQGVHPPIIMAALRTADYLQIQPDRAPSGTLKIRKLRSPFSEGEWRVHQSVRNITPADNDPEAIYVDSRPETVETFLKFQEWTKSFQAELDSTWAALGEVYGRFSQQGFDKFGLRLRRLRTSIDDISQFSKEVKYVPAQIAFEASSADLLNLLVAPLYGDSPEIGLRELIQNSLDAIRERTHIEGSSPSDPVCGRDVDVLVYPKVEGDEVCAVVVEDRGIGMDVDILRNYFLKAGASFRNSPEWKKSFTSEDGHTEISRSGRFGVGALAGFLVGSSIHIETRRLGEARGLTFDAELDRDSIELRYCDRSVGTKITLFVPPERRESVTQLFSTESDRWDWYCLPEPSLCRLDIDERPLEAEFVFSESQDWVSIETESMDRVIWSYKTVRGSNSYNSERGLFVNGIFVMPLKDYGIEPKLLDRRNLGTGVGISTPSVLLTDNDSRANLNLQRNALTKTDLPLSDAIRESIALDLVAQAIAFAPEKSLYTFRANSWPVKRNLSAEFSLTYRHQETGWPFRIASHWCWEDAGWRLAVPTSALHKNFLLAIFNRYNLDFLRSHKSVLGDTSVVWARSGASINNTGDLKNVFRHYHGSLSFMGRRATVRIAGYTYPVGCQFVVSRGVFDRLMDKPPRYLEHLLSSEKSLKGDYVRFGDHQIHEPLSSAMERGLATQSKDGFAYMIIGGENQHAADKLDIFHHHWQDFVGGRTIPLNFADRPTAFPKAFNQLGARIEYHRRSLKK